MTPQDIMTNIGIPFEDRDLKNSYSWDGKSISLKANQLCHEIAHWIIATPERRSMPDYGLGTAPESGIRTERVLSYDACQAEEAMASMLGIAYEAMIGVNFMYTLNEHDWFSSYQYQTSCWEMISQLNRMGLMIGHLPTLGGSLSQ